MSHSYRINAPDVTCEIFDGEVLVVNLRSGAYYSLRDSAAVVWSLLAEGRTPAEIGRLLASRLAVAETEAIAWLEGFVAELAGEALVVPMADAGVTAPANGALPERLNRPVIERYTDMQELLKLDPIHEVDLSGWPVKPADPKGA